MIVPVQGTSHLYQYLTVLGAFVSIASMYSMSVVFDSHDATLRGVIEKLLVTRELSEEERESWTDYLVGRKKNTETVLFVLSLGVAVGLTMFLAGAACWYVFVQRFEDMKRRLENRQLE